MSYAAALFVLLVGGFFLVWAVGDLGSALGALMGWLLGIGVIVAWHLVFD